MFDVGTFRLGLSDLRRLECTVLTSLRRKTGSFAVAYLKLRKQVYLTGGRNRAERAVSVYDIHSNEW